MKLRAIIVVLIFIGSAGFCQPANSIAASSDLAFSNQYEAALVNQYLDHHTVNYLELFLAPSVDENDEHLKAYIQEFDSYIELLKKKQKRYARDNQFLEYLFYRTHNKFLKNYEQYGTLTDLFEKGKYDCLTGTAFYALILDRLGYQYQIFESNYHALLLIDAPDRQYLFESTDFVNGFLNDPMDIRERLDYYNNLSASRKNDGGYYNFQNTKTYIIGLQELVGLQYYNQAIKFYNQRQIGEASDLLNKALVFYQSPRIKEFQQVVRSVQLSGEPLSMNY